MKRYLVTVYGAGWRLRISAIARSSCAALCNVLDALGDCTYAGSVRRV